MTKVLMVAMVYPVVVPTCNPLARSPSATVPVPVPCCICTHTLSVLFSPTPTCSLTYIYTSPDDDRTNRGASTVCTYTYSYTRACRHICTYTYMLACTARFALLWVAIRPCTLYAATRPRMTWIITSRCHRALGILSRSIPSLSTGRNGTRRSAVQYEYDALGTRRTAQVGASRSRLARPGLACGDLPSPSLPLEPLAPSRVGRAAPAGSRAHSGRAESSPHVARRTSLRSESTSVRHRRALDR